MPVNDIGRELGFLSATVEALVSRVEALEEGDAPPEFTEAPDFLTQCMNDPSKAVAFGQAAGNIISNLLPKGPGNGAARVEVKPVPPPGPLAKDPPIERVP